MGALNIWSAIDAQTSALRLVSLYILLPLADTMRPITCPSLHIRMAAGLPSAGEHRG